MNRTTCVISLIVSLLTAPAALLANSPADLDDLEIAHVAYTVDEIDIRYAHMALAKSKSPRVREFAETMIRDHTIVNQKALALLKKLGVSPKDNYLSRQLEVQSDKIIEEMSKLSGPEFDRYYSNNELAYHKAANGLVETVFLMNVQNPELKALLEEALLIFRSHEHSAHETVVVLTY